LIAIPDWIPVALSLLALIASLALGVRAAQDRRANFQISREREIYSWAVETLRIIPEFKSKDENAIEVAKNRLSVQIDIGRLLFPNDRNNDFGKDKHPLNHGYRSKVLDPLVGIYDIGSPLEDRYELERFDWLVKDFIYEVGTHFPPVKTNTSPEYLSNWSKKKRG